MNVYNTIQEYKSYHSVSDNIAIFNFYFYFSRQQVKDKQNNYCFLD
jgi:hypothetical protein